MVYNLLVIYIKNYWIKTNPPAIIVLMFCLKVSLRVYAEVPVENDN